MKRCILNPLLLLIGTTIWLLPLLSLAQPGYKPKYLRENNRELLDLASQTNETGWVIFRQDKEVVDADKFFDRFGKAIGLGEHYNMRLVKDQTDVKEGRHQRYQLYYKNILVEGVEYFLHSKNKRLIAINGRMVDGLDIDVEKPMPEKNAQAFALAYRSLTEAEAEKSGKLPKGELIITQLVNSFDSRNFRLCYVFDMYIGKSKRTETGLDPERVYVDATTGDIIRTSPLILHCFANHSHLVGPGQVHKQPNRNYGELAQLFTSATFIPLPTPNNPTNANRFGTTLLSFEVEGSLSFNWLSVPGTGLNTRIAAGTLNRDSDGRATETLRDLWDRSLNTSISGTLNWGTQSQRATTAHWLMQRCLDFWQTKLGRNGISGNGGYPPVLVDVPGIGYNASWSSLGLISYWNAPTQTPLIIADVTGHELAHAITEATCNLLYEGESGALNEALSDIFGTAFERHLFPDGSAGQWNWNIGEDVQTFRDMANPPRIIDAVGRRQPQVFQDGNWFPINPPCDININDACGVHYNSGVLNKWFHTLSTGQGPNGTSINGIGFDQALNIVYDAQRLYLGRFSTYQDAAWATRTAASFAYGECSPQQRAVIAAWATAGITVEQCLNSCDYNISSVVLSGNPTCNQAITLTINCAGNAAGNACNGLQYTVIAPNTSNFPIYSTNSTVNITAPSTSGNYNLNVWMGRATGQNPSNCYLTYQSIPYTVSCGGSDPCDFSSGPRRVGTWNGLEVQIRQLPNGKKVLVTALVGSSTDRYFPRGDNFWNAFTQDPNVSQYQSCLNGGTTDYGGLALPGGLTPPAGYAQGQTNDGAIYFELSGDPCTITNGPRYVGTWNGLDVQIRQYGNVRCLVTAIAGSSNDKHFPRGDNFWDNFTKDSNIPQSTLDQWRNCLNAGTTDWYGLVKPNSVSPPPGYQQGTTNDGAVFFSTNGLRKAAAEPGVEAVTLVQVLPNPTADELRVRFQAKAGDGVTIRLHSIGGTLLKTASLTATDGQNEHILRLGTLPTGIYLVETLIQGQRIMHKVLKD